jgi:hypothetical protein
MTQNQQYTVVKKYSEFEIRNYPSGMQIETEVSGDFLNAGNKAFGSLIRFISGNNSKNKKIAMTAPVIQESLDDKNHKVRFVMPAEMDSLSTPNSVDGQVKVINVAAHLAAARKFSGSWSGLRIKNQSEKLMTEIQNAGLVSEGNLYYSRFDPPWKPGFLRHNEVLIRLKSL